MNWLVPLSDLDFGDEEEAAVRDVLRSRWLTMGAVTRQFEEDFAARAGARHAVAVSNATVALHLACLALQLGPGDEVILPALTFVASASAVLYTGAEVRFADIIGPHEPTLDPAEIERRITPNTRAILVMHYGGHPCRMPEILEIARGHHLAVIEDAAHAPGAALDGRALGTWGDAGCFSFFSNKNLATGEGGMLLTDRDDIARQVRLLRSHAMTTLTWDRHQGHAHSYDVVDLGFNYRIDELHAALGLVQLGKLEANNARRAEIVAGYRDAFQDTDLELPFPEQRGRPAHHIFPVLLPPEAPRTPFIESLRDAGVQTSLHYPPIHQFSYYRQRYPGVALPQTEDFAGREVTLPLYPSMTGEAVETVITAVRQALEQEPSTALGRRRR